MGLLNAALLSKLAIDRDLNEGELYSKDLKSKVELTVADACKLVIMSPDFEEGKLSVTFNRAAIISQAKQLYIANGESDKADTVGLDFTISADPLW